MAALRRYKELIFTDHALTRIKERKVDQSEAWATWRRPQRRYFASTKQAWVFQRNWKHRQIEVVAKQNERGEWVVLSVWSNYVAYKPAKSVWMRMWKWLVKKVRR